jgi:hypothetical protein
LPLSLAITYIGISAFNAYSGLTELRFGTNVRTIGGAAFTNCSGLSGSLVMPNLVTSIGKDTFNGYPGGSQATNGKLVNTRESDEYKDD